MNKLVTSLKLLNSKRYRKEYKNIIIIIIIIKREYTRIKKNKEFIKVGKKKNNRISRRRMGAGINEDRDRGRI